jgi:hypothetical protein
MLGPDATVPLSMNFKNVYNDDATYTYVICRRMRSLDNDGVLSNDTVRTARDY